MPDYPATAPEHTRPTSDTCLAPGCDDPGNVLTRKLLPSADVPRRPLATVRGTDLCVAHHAELPQRLEEMVRLYVDVEGAIVRRPSAGGDRVRSSSVSEGAAMWNSTASHVIAEVDDWAAMLVRTVLNHRKMPAPRTRTFVRPAATADANADAALAGRPAPAAITVDTITHTFEHGLRGHEHPRLQLAVLARHHAYWLSAYPHNGVAFLTDARDHVRAMGRALSVQPTRFVTLTTAACRYVVDETDFGPVLCGGQLRGILTTPDARRPSVITCAANPGHLQLGPDDWMTYAAGA